MSLELLLCIALVVIVLAVVHHFGLKAVREAVFAYVGTELAALRAELASLRAELRASSTIASSAPPKTPPTS